MDRRWLVGIGIGFGLAACAGGPDLAKVEQSVGGCAPDFCSHNSPTIAHYGMYRFARDGQLNDAGYGLLGLVKGGHTYDLVVQDSKILGLEGGKVVLEGPSLVDARIVLEHNGDQQAIVIRQVGKTYEVVDPHQLLETYVLDWDEVVAHKLPGFVTGGQSVPDPVLAGNPEAVCPEPPDFDAKPSSGDGTPRLVWDESAKMAPWDSLVFEGDMIDSYTRDLDTKPDDNWFNVGCAAHLLTKLRLTRNTIHTAPSWEHAQTAIRLLSAQYCHRTAFTVDGEPLVWQNDNGMTYNSTPKILEARWGTDGALCIGEPRLEYTDNAIPWIDVDDDIHTECPKVPVCQDPYPWKPAYLDEYATSANPY